MIRIDGDKLAGLAASLVKIPSQNPPGEEAEINEFLLQKMERLGFKVSQYSLRSEATYLVGVLDLGEGSSIIFDGHVDTVPAERVEDWIVDPFSGEVIDGRLYGRGAADMKASIAAWLTAVEAVLNSEAELKGKIMTFLVSDEETYCNGTRDILSEGRYYADMAVVGEPTELNIGVAHKGVMRWRLITYGRAAHSSSPEMGVNAIYKMARAITAIQEYSKRLGDRRHRLLGYPTVSVGTIRGGEKDNVVPDLCEASIERRLIPGEQPGMVEEELTGLLDDIRMDDPEFKYKLERYSTILPSEIEENSEVVKVMIKAVEEGIGRHPRIIGFNATCEMVHLVERGIPTVIFGAGSLNQAHKVNEHVDLKEVTDASRAYAHFIIEVLSR